VPQSAALINNHKPQSATLISKKRAKIVEKPQFCRNESGHVNGLSVTENHKQWK